MLSNQHILMIPEWFPNPENPQLGVFIEKHIKLIAKDFPVSVLYIQSVKNLQAKSEIIVKNGSFKFIHARYRQSSFRLLNTIRYSKIVKKALQNIEKPDIIHLHVTGKNYLIRKLFFKSTPFVITEHWSGFLSGKTLIGESYTREAFHKASGISCVSEYLKKNMTDYFRLENSIITANKIEKSNSILEKRNHIQMISVADLEDKTKNISGILSALKKISFSQLTKYSIIGDGADKEQLMRQAAQLKNENLEIIFQGRKTNEECLIEIANADFLIMNSRKETFSMVCAEAILAGKPVVASRCGGPEFFLNDSNSLVVDVDQDEQLRAAIEKMLTTFQLYSSEKISDEAKKVFSDDAIMNGFKLLYQTVKK